MASFYIKIPKYSLNLNSCNIATLISSYYIIVTSEIKASAYDGKPFLKFSSAGNACNTLAAIVLQPAKCFINSAT